MVWEEPPPLIPAAADPAKLEPSAAPLPKRKAAKQEKKISAHVALVSEGGNKKERKAGPSPSPAPVPDPAEARNEAKERWQEKEEELKLEKEQIENGIRNLTGSVPEQWKYRLAVCQER